MSPLCLSEKCWEIFREAVGCFGAGAAGRAGRLVVGREWLFRRVGAAVGVSRPLDVDTLPLCAFPDLSQGVLGGRPQQAKPEEAAAQCSMAPARSDPGAVPRRRRPRPACARSRLGPWWFLEAKLVTAIMWMA